MSRSIIAEALLKKMLAERGRDDVVVTSGGIAPYARDTSLVSMDARLVLRDDAIEIAPDTMACDLKRHRDRLTNAIGLNASGQTIMQITAPGIAGFLIAAVSSAVVVLGLVVVLGSAGQMNLAQAAF